MKNRWVKALVVLGIGVAIWFFYSYDLGQYLTLEYLKSQKEAFSSYYQENTATTLAAYLLIYITSTALSLPGATILTLAGGAFFGLTTGTILVSFASTIGATLAFMVARLLLRDSIQSKFADKLKTINEGVERDGALYLFTLRLIPATFRFGLRKRILGWTEESAPSPN